MSPPAMPHWLVNRSYQAEQRDATEMVCEQEVITFHPAGATYAHVPPAEPGGGVISLLSVTPTPGPTEGVVLVATWTETSGAYEGNEGVMVMWCERYVPGTEGIPSPDGVVIRGTMWPGYAGCDGGIWNVPRWSEVYPAEPVN